MKDTAETKRKVLDGALKVFKERGHKFTMDDLATELSMSKKTIYKVFHDKSAMLYDLIDYVFDEIKVEEQKLYEDDSLPADEKFMSILAIMPEKFSDIDFSMVYSLSEKYPKHYRKLQKRLESGWETTWTILDEAVALGYFRDVNKKVFMLTYSAALERFLSNNELAEANIAYADAVSELVHMLVDGIRK